MENRVTYKHPNGETVIITDPNCKNIMEREGFTLVEPKQKKVKQ